MTGVTLLLSRHLSRPSSWLSPTSPLQWTYDKTENLPTDSNAPWEKFTHLLSEWPECKSSPVPGQGVTLFRPISTSSTTSAVESDEIFASESPSSTSEFYGIHLKFYPISTLASPSSSTTFSIGPSWLPLPFSIEPFETVDATRPDGRVITTSGWSVFLRTRGGKAKSQRGNSTKAKPRGISVGFKRRRVVWICERI